MTESARAAKPVTDALTEGRRKSAAGRMGPPLRPLGLVALQRSAGNAAVNALLAGRWRSPGEEARTVQRHNSYEHQFLGDTKPQQLKSARLKYPERSGAARHLIEDEMNRAMFFQHDVGADPRQHYPNIRWI